MTGHELRRERYFEYLRANALRFGFDREIADMANRVKNGVRNDTPPVERWHLILPTARLLEAVRVEFGVTIVNSAHRTPAYNDAVGSDAPESKHIENSAIDFRCATGVPSQWAAFLRFMRARGDFKGGIGVYPNFVHVDTRGTNADWEG